MKEFLLITKALSDENRVRALMALGGGELCVCQIIELLGLAPSTVSRHMGVLHQAGLVETRKDGRWIYYRLTEEAELPCTRTVLDMTLECLSEDKRVQDDTTRMKSIRNIDRNELCAHYHKQQSEKLKVLFLCTGNSCRSQMAEGWTRYLKSDVIEGYSAGIETHGLNPNAVKVMAEAGVDISNHQSKNVADLMDIPFDYIVTVCSSANETCPIFPGNVKVIHVGFDDPPSLAKNTETPEAVLDCYRKVRNEIRAYIETLPESLKQKG